METNTSSTLLTDDDVETLCNFNDGDFPKSLPELDSWSEDKEHILVNMVNAAKEHHVTGEKFKQSFGVSFSYTTLSNRLKDRGWECSWHKVSLPESPDDEAPDLENRSILSLTSLAKENKCRMSLSVSKEVSTEWQSFISAKCSKNDYVRLLNEAALVEFMDAHKDTHFQFLSE